MKKYDKAFNTDTFHLDWEKIYLLPSKVTLHTRLLEFQNKILNRILYTNEMLFKIKKVDSPWRRTLHVPNLIPIFGRPNN